MSVSGSDTSDELGHLTHRLVGAVPDISRRPINYYVTVNRTLVEKAQQNNYHGARATLGPPSQARDADHQPAPAADQLTNGDDAASHDPPTLDPSDRSRPPTPEGYVLRRDIANFYNPGRYFGIWDPPDTSLHRKQFVLLDAQHDEGRCLHVEQPDADHLLSKSDLYRTHLAFFRSRDEQQKQAAASSSSGDAAPPDADIEAVYMHQRVQRNVPPGSYVCLNHTHTISFHKHKCKDLGLLAPASLKKVRKHMVLQDIENWGLIEEIKAESINWE